MFLGKSVLKMCSKFTAEHPCQSNFIKIALRHGGSPVNSVHISEHLFLRTPFDT